MPFAKLNRNWFSNGFRYRSDRGRIEISKGQIKDLPSDAEVYSDTGELLGKAGEIRDMKFPEKSAEPSPEKKAALEAITAKKEPEAAKPAGLDLTKK